jgi:hypothetical protein
MVEPVLEKQASNASGWDDDGDGWDEDDAEDSEMQGEHLACQFANGVMPAPNDKGFKIVPSAQISQQVLVRIEEL